MSTQNSPPADPSLSVYAEASVWLAQLHGSQRSAALESDFRDWLAANPQHALAFERATEVWEAVGNLDPAGLSRPMPAVTPLPSPRYRAPVFAGCAAAACALLAVVAFWLLQARSYSTDIGEQRVVRLDDGTQVSLNSATRIDIDYDDARRLVRLRQGEVLFEVAHMPRRPFIVVAGDRVVTAVGTAFVVRRADDRVDVTLLQGRVTVAPARPNPPQRPGTSSDQESSEETISLNVGQRLMMRSSEIKLDTRPAEDATAWRRGEVIFEDTPLSDAVEEMNRYDRSRLVIGPDVGALLISGVYRIGNNEDFARALARIYEVDVRREGDHIHIQMASTPAR